MIGSFRIGVPKCIMPKVHEDTVEALSSNQESIPN